MEPESSLKALVESAGDAIQSVHPDGTVTYVNPAWLTALSMTPDNVLGRRIEEFIHPEHLDDWRMRFGEILKGGGSGRFETALLNANGDIVFFEGRCYRGGSTGQIFGIFQNVTERKRAEEVLTRQADELLKVSQSLERRDQEIAEQLEQARRYREAQERAEELGRINEELKAEVERRRKAEEQITASLREKEVLLKEIHHRVKNNLQVISSLLNLQLGDIRDQATLDLFNDSQTRIRSMALIHERLYQSDDLATVDFAEYVESLGRYIFRSYARSPHLRFETEVDQVSLNLDDAIPCGLIVNELVCNALKYGFEEGASGRVWVRFHHHEDGSRHLVVGDDGVGLPEDVSLDNPTSLGLRLVSTLVGQLDGETEVDRSRGTEFHIRF